MRYISLQKRHPNSENVVRIYCAIPKKLLGDYACVSTLESVGFVMPTRLAARVDPKSGTLAFRYFDEKRKCRVFSSCNYNGCYGSHCATYANAVDYLLDECDPKLFSNFVISANNPHADRVVIKKRSDRNYRIMVSTFAVKDDIGDFTSIAIHANSENDRVALRKAREIRKQALHDYGEYGVKSGFLIRTTDPRLVFV